MLKERTWRDYERLVRLHIPEALLDTCLAAVSRGDVERCLSSASDANSRKLRTILNQVFEDAMHSGVCNTNPIVGLRLGRRQPEPRLRHGVVLSPSQVEDLASCLDPAYSTLVRFAAYSGLRFGELAALTASDVNLDAQTVTVTKQWCGLTCKVTSPKSHASYRIVLYADPVASAIGELVAERRSAPHLFATHTGARLSNVNFNNRVWRPAARALDLADYRFHDLRHTYASLLVRGGVNLALVSRLLGHSSPQVTLEVYAGVFGDDLVHARKVLNALAS